MNETLAREALEQAKAELRDFEFLHSEIINRWQWLIARVGAHERDLRQLRSKEKQSGQEKLVRGERGG